MVIANIIPIVFKFLEVPTTQTTLRNVINYYQQDKLLMVFACLTAGVVEELLFRAYLMPRIEVFFKSGWIVVLLSSLIFGFAHMSGMSVVGIIVPILIGGLFSLHYYLYRNIASLVIVHFLIDFASFISA